MKRTFVIYTTPHVADPALCCPVVETTEGNQIMYANVNALKDLIEEMEYSRAYNAGYALAETSIYKSLGIKTPMEFEDLVNKLKNISEKP